jgi:prepilin-type N-terminal cleavage/methylation domain-containing protein
MKNTKRSTQATPRKPGFTLIEMIVAIGAVAIIAVGIAAIFESIGRTVAGGRRISVLNQYAALIERQLRADFDAMTRDGVLVIHHQLALNGNPVQVHVEDTNPRPRRIDEIVFFVRGDHSSSRAPIIPGFTAESSEAMIYIGHGQRLDPLQDYGATPAYEEPQVDDGWLPQTGGGGRPYRLDLALGNAADPTNPNRFASDWTLLRKVVVLSTPGGSLQNLPPAGDPIWGELNLSYADAIDNEVQVGGQPAASSVFRTLAALFPRDYPYPANFVRGAASDGPRYPTIASGIVDAATTDLAEIRRIMLDVNQEPWNVGGELHLFDPGSPDQALLNDRYSHATGGAGSQLRFLQSWMDDLLPTHPESGQRIRYEPSFPDYFGTLSNYGDTDMPDQPIRLADQRALGSGIFVPNCTEFAVDYSFGQTVTSGPYEGQLVWFGLDRSVTIDGNQVTVVQRYPIDATTGTTRSLDVTYEKLDGTTATKKLTKTMLYDVNDVGNYGGGNPPPSAVAHFGYNDPTYAPSDPLVDPATIPWPWPKLIRVTITLADPTDPSIEQSFQFIFETPEGQAS